MNFLHSTLVRILLTCFFVSSHAQKADLVVYSFDRPMQLYALLESVTMYLSNVGEIRVIYRASDERYEAGYGVVKKDFSKALYVRQGNNPKQDFQPLTLDAVFSSPNAYVVFAVDDIIVKDFVDLAQCIDLMERTGAYGFYLRLGKNITYSYMENKYENVPNLTKVDSDVYSWTLREGQRLWRYANTVDMTVYKKKEIESDLRGLKYENPNTFEGRWDGLMRKVVHRKALCFEQSKIVNLPLNLVQNTWTINRHMNEYTPIQLLERFEKGMKIDIRDLHKVENKGPHMEFSPRFVVRD